MTIYSYSRINTYFTCPSQFQYRYILKVPSPVAEGVELFLGSRFHETMEYLYNQVPQRVPTVNELMDYFKKHWENQYQEAVEKQRLKKFDNPLRIVNEGQTVEDYFQKGQLYLENYYHQYHPFDQDKTEAIEMKVMFDLDNQKQYRMQGYIDRLGRDDEGVLWIHDYKTSSRKLSEEDVKNEDQLALYQIGLSQHPRYGANENIKYIWHFVAFEKDQVVGERNAKEIDWLKQKYISKIKTIEKAQDFLTKTSALCGWCEFLTLCADGQAAVENRKKKKEEKAEASSSPAPVVISEPAPAGESASPVPAANSQFVFGEGSPRAKRRRVSSVSQDQLSLF
jgi:RecB family exonuclease